MTQEILSLEARTQRLSAEIAKYTRKGYRVQSQTAISAQLVKPKKFSFVFAFLWFLLLGVGLLIYLLYYLAKRDKLVWIEVDETGRVTVK